MKKEEIGKKMSKKEENVLRAKKLKELQAEGRAMFGSHNTSRAKFKRLRLSR